MQQLVLYLRKDDLAPAPYLQNPRHFLELVEVSLPYSVMQDLK